MPFIEKISVPYDTFWTFIISFEEAQAFRRASGGYLRENQWEDLTVDVYI